MKKIWICGASGMLGSHFKELLTRRKTPFVANDYTEVDITCREAVSDFVSAEKVTHIVNCAAYTQVDKAEEDLKQAYLVNAMGPYHLAVAAKKHGARVIHFSTDYVFDGTKRSPYIEKDTCSPLGAYGISKLAGEMKLTDELSDSCIIRTSWLFGYPGKNFVSTMIRLMCEKEHLRVVDNQFGRPTYCSDLALITVNLLDREGIYHFANSGETSWYDFAVEIHRRASELGFPLTVRTIEPVPDTEYPTPAKRPSYSTLSTDKITGFLNYPPRPWHEALHDYLLQLQKHLPEKVSV